MPETRKKITYGREAKKLTITTDMYLLVLPLVFLASVVDSIGGGGGLISLPAYTLAGLPYGFASGCNKFSACFGTLASTLRYFKSRKILWLPALCAILGALPGSWIGTRVSILLSNEFMHIFMICAIPMVAVVMLLKKDAPAREVRLTRGTLALCGLTGLLTGFYDGFFGPGTGTFLILLFSAFTGMDLVAASATAKPVNLASNLSSLITRVLAGQVIYALAVPAMCLSVLGGFVGTKFALTSGARFIRYVMLGVLVLLVIKLVFELF